MTDLEKQMAEALRRIADPRNTHFAGDAQVVAREALALFDAQAAEQAGDDPCPGCRPGGVCRTPKCGRLKQAAGGGV